MFRIIHEATCKFFSQILIQVSPKVGRYYSAICLKVHIPFYPNAYRGYSVQFQNTIIATLHFLCLYYKIHCLVPHKVCIDISFQQNYGLICYISYIYPTSILCIKQTHYNALQMCHCKVIFMSYIIKDEAQQNEIHSLAYNVQYAGVAHSKPGAAKLRQLF